MPAGVDRQISGGRAPDRRRLRPGRAPKRPTLWYRTPIPTPLRQAVRSGSFAVVRFVRRRIGFARRFAGFLRRHAGFVRGFSGRNESVYAP